ncbi:unnamed protein product [Medioppia subpectinata]|uniref:protein-tyrosine-phosphatase n=1 Tax=Medioppia subpectinata TaxID=1979941 RepID=A0A7R9KBP3_9ACAR|nr:unnamed protein product [Medioppia subpectinata]CAG2100482.1 unnamed protein product [Medioppia subpectinata]
MDQIWHNLYLGSMNDALDSTQHIRYNIKTIVTVMDKPIADGFHCKDITYHWINAKDHENQDLLTYFPMAYDMIDAAVTASTVVLVHCRRGISRSATIVISYLMQKLRKPYEEIRELVVANRPAIYPIDGFVDQLRLFESMAYGLDANDRRFRQYLLKTYGTAPEECLSKYVNIFDAMDVAVVARNSILVHLVDGISRSTTAIISYLMATLWRSSYEEKSLVSVLEDRLNQYFERLSVAEKLTPDLVYGPQYECIGCGEGLFNEIHVIRNDGSDKYKGMDVCGRVFIEPQRWMGWTKVTETVIRCQTCGQLVGRLGPIYPEIECKCGHHMDVKTRLTIRMINNKFKKVSQNQ